MIRLIVIGIIFDKDKVLLGRKTSSQSPFGGSWYNPGGDVEDLDLGLKLVEEKDFTNDYLVSELKREIKEETNLEIKDIEFIGEQPMIIYKNNNKYIFLHYKTNYQAGDLKAGSDFVEVKWVSLNDLSKIDLTDLAREFLNYVK